MDNFEKLKVLTGEKDGVLLQILLDDAEQFVLFYTQRSRMIPALEKTSRSAAGESYSFEDAPKHVYEVLNRYRLARVGGRVYETETE
mgnify:CR=1 FL=1